MYAHNMRPAPRSVLLLIAFVVLALAGPQAQHRLQPVAALRGAPALELMLRKLDTVGNVMMTTAHPDDENNALLAYYGLGRGYRTSLVTATRGEGGQNEIGPELFEALAVLRTEELLAAHRFDGAEQYFTRAVDFGYSFSVEETLEKWGKQEILGDYVRMIRTVRPDVIVGFVFDGAGGGQHHQASARLTAEAFRAAADPAAFPEQIAKEGLRPWQAKKYYYTAGFGGPGGGQALPGEGAAKLLMFHGGDAYDPVLGRTYSEISGEARSMHKCQGMSQLLPLPAGDVGFGAGARGYRLRDTVFSDGVNRGESDLFDGVDTRISSLAAYAGAQPPADLTTRLASIGAAVNEARGLFQKGGGTAAVPALLRGLSLVRGLRSQLANMGMPADGRFEIDQRLKLKDAQFGEALLLAADVRLEAVAQDGLVVAGQTVQLNLLAANRSGVVPVMMSRRSLSGFETQGELCKDDALMRGSESRSACTITARIPATARLTAAHFKYATDAARFVVDADVPAGLPFRPTPFTATFLLNIAGADVATTIPVEFRSEGNLFSGEKRSELHVVPKLAVSVSPDIAVVPTDATSQKAAPTTVRVTVTNHTTGGAKAEVRLDLSEGWKSVPASAPITFTREDEAITARFQLIPPALRKAGAVTVKARVTEGAATYSEGYQVVEYPHTTRRHVLRAPEVVVKSLDVKVKPNLSIGYVMGVGDEIPPALEQLGARVTLLTGDDLAWGDLNRFDVVMTGVRAYERRADLRAYNQRLIDYARAGGTVIVNYNKFEFNEAQYGPFPAKVGRERVTDENAEVRILQPKHAAFTTPNQLSRADWIGWVQERGLYFLDTPGRDPQMVDLVELEDPFPYNKGAKRGALVEAKVGQGRWIYIGLGLWRQLPAGTDGAYRLLANLISLGTAPRGATSSAQPR
jgi:LmbE family N-acetylglucosaminyl deacetylase